MTALQAALLGIVQGLTEFLPISSSAHLILARMFFGWEDGEVGLAFDVACHLGTLLALLVYFRRDVASLVAAVPDAASGARSEPARLVRSLTVGTLPILVVGLLFAEVLSTSVRTAAVAGVALALGAVVMILAERWGTRDRTEMSLTTAQALWLGFAQAVALIPGVSRSGAVLTIGMMFGLKRERAARFSFLLGIPAILAAAASQTMNLMAQGLPTGALGLFALGLGESALVGYLTVKYFIRYVARYPLHLFAAYRLALAAGVLVWVVRG